MIFFAFAGRWPNGAPDRGGVDENNLLQRPTSLCGRIEQINPYAHGPMDVTTVGVFSEPYSGGASIRRPPDLGG